MMKSRYPAFPYILFMTIFIVVPLLIVVYFAFTTSDGSFTLQNIIRVKNWMNFLLRTYAWMTILEDNGLINKLLALIGIGPVHMINTQGAVVLGMVYDYLPFMIVPLYTVLMKMDYSLIQAAQDLGGNPFQVFTKVILPLSLPGISTGITMVFIPCVSTLVISKMLGGGTELLIGDLIEMQFTGNTYNQNLGSAMALVLMVIILICMGVMNQFDSDEEKEGSVVI